MNQESNEGSDIFENMLQSKNLGFNFSSNNIPHDEVKMNKKTSEDKNIAFDLGSESLMEKLQTMEQKLL